jgi:hypothetical protein
MLLNCMQNQFDANNSFDTRPDGFPLTKSVALLDAMDTSSQPNYSSSLRLLSADFACFTTKVRHIASSRPCALCVPVSIAGEWSARLLCILVVLGSHLGAKTDHLDKYSWSSSVYPGKCRNSALNFATTASFHILSNSLILSSDAI